LGFFTVAISGGCSASGEDGLLVPRHDGGHLAVLGEAPRLELREQEGVVLLDLEAAAVARDEDQLRDATLVLLEELFRQTDGSRLVVSNRAIGDLDLQRDPPWVGVESPSLG